MQVQRRWLVWGWCLAWLWPVAARAGDGALVWRTVDTPHFQVHFPVGLDAVAFRAARLCEEAHEVITPLLEHTPDERTQVVLTDFGDSANGSATALPYLRIRLFAAPPSLDGNLNNYDDWLRLLIFHEYVHILHLDTTTGLPDLLNRIFGKTFAPNQNLPSFHLEGTAVWLESLTSRRGRVRSSLFRGFLRTQALAGRLFDIDEVTHAPLDWPGGNVWYLYGGHFVNWLVEQRHPSVIAGINRAISDNLIPFGLNRAASAVTGETLTSMWRRWQADLVMRSRAERAALVRQPGGLTVIESITTLGRHHQRPRFLPDGTLLALESDGHSPSALYARADGGRGPRRLILDNDSTDSFDACDDGQTLVLDGNVRWRGAYSYTDLFLYDLVDRRTRRVTVGGRLREPACAPGSRWAVAAQIVRGRTRLVSVDLVTGEIRTLHDPGGLDQMAFPTVSPDGRHVVALRVSQIHGRDLVAVDIDPKTGELAGALRPITRDGALELHPRFSPDGRWLFYASDATSIFDIYARAWPDGPTHRVTRTVGGALEPALAPDGRTLAMRTVGAGGFDLGRLTFDPAALLATPRAGTSAKLASHARPPTSARPLPTRPYAPSETVWPVAWSPAFAFSSPTEAATQLGLSVEGSDAASHHTFFANIDTRPEEETLGTSVAYGYHRFAPTLGASLSRTTVTRGNSSFFNGERHDYRERVTSAATSLSLPFSRAGHSASGSMRYSYTRYDPAENTTPTYDPIDPEPRAPPADRSGLVAFSLGYRSTEAYAYSVATEKGQSVGLTFQFRHPSLGGDYETSEFFLTYQGYLALWARHTLGLRLRAANGRGRTRGRVFYSLTSAPERNVLLDALDQIRFGNNYLRGYPPGTERGDRYVLAKLEYRMPLFELYRGLSMVPYFFRGMKLLFFTDWAQARQSPLELEMAEFRRSFGVEVIGQQTLGWRLSFDVRIGYARGVDDDGETQWYFYLGSWF